MRRAAVGLVACVAVLGVLPSPAQSTTISSEMVSTFPRPTPELHYTLTGDPRERNNPQSRVIANPLAGLRSPLSVARGLRDLGLVVVPDGLLEATNWVEFSDVGNPVRVPDDDTRRLCASALVVAYCAVPQSPISMGLNVDLADGADRFERTIGTTSPSHIRGGEGDDVIRSFSAGRIEGGPGDDVLDGTDMVFATFDGGSGNDRIMGSPGHDSLTGGLGADVLAGGGGLDSVGYYSDLIPEGVSVDLDGVADDGRPGEGDNVLADVENLSGTLADDVLVGSDAVNRISGHEGNDRLEGGDGADLLNGGLGNDRLNGGQGQDEVAGHFGNDVLELADGEVDRYSCGPDVDILYADPFDVRLSTPDCEQ